MAIVVLTNAKVTVNSIDLSDHVQSVKVTSNPDMLESTAMGATYHTSTYGLKNGSIEVTFFQDRATGKVDATLSPLVGAATVYTVIVTPDGSVVSATNPSWTITNAQMSGDYDGVSGAVGELEMITVTFVPGSGGTLTRATS